MIKETIDAKNNYDGDLDAITLMPDIKGKEIELRLNDQYVFEPSKPVRLWLDDVPVHIVKHKDSGKYYVNHMDRVAILKPEVNVVGRASDSVIKLPYDRISRDSVSIFNHGNSLTLTNIGRNLITLTQVNTYGLDRPTMYELATDDDYVNRFKQAKGRYLRRIDQDPDSADRRIKYDRTNDKFAIPDLNRYQDWRELVQSIPLFQINPGEYTFMKGIYVAKFANLDKRQISNIGNVRASIDVAQLNKIYNVENSSFRNVNRIIGVDEVKHGFLANRSNVDFAGEFVLCVGRGYFGEIIIIPAVINDESGGFMPNKIDEKLLTLLTTLKLNGLPIPRLTAESYSKSEPDRIVAMMKDKILKTQNSTLFNF